MRTYTLSKSAREDVLEKVSKLTGGRNLKTKELKIAEQEDSSLAIIFDEKEKLFLGRKGDAEYFPLLRDGFILPTLPSVTVDTGAVKFVCNGANIMRPGIMKIEGEFGASTLLVVKEERHGKAIAVGRATVSKSEMESAKKGQVVENLHYVGDKYWDMLKEMPIAQ